jgi:hypothetical protein
MPSYFQDQDEKGSLHRLQQRCEHVRTRPAGSSAIVEADLPSGGRGGAAQEAAGEADSE